MGLTGRKSQEPLLEDIHQSVPALKQCLFYFWTPCHLETQAAESSS